MSRFWGHKQFYSIDLYGDEMAQPIENFIPIYEKAKEFLRLYQSGCLTAEELNEIRLNGMA